MSTYVMDKFTLEMRTLIRLYRYGLSNVWDLCVKALSGNAVICVYDDDDDVGDDICVRERGSMR
jgi:hypothetical protein